MEVVGWVPVEDAARARALAREDRARRWRRLARRHRRTLAAVLLAIAAGLALQVLRPPAPVTTAVLAAARALPPGHRLAADDLAVAHLPPAAVPDGAWAAGTAGAPAGEVLSGAVGRGEVLTPTRTLGAGLLAAAPPGTVALPVAVSTPLPDGALRPGDAVAVLAGSSADPYAGLDGLDDDGLAASTGTGGRGAGGAGSAGGGLLLVRSATVVAAPGAPAADPGLLGSGAGGLGGTGGVTVLLALTTEQAEAVVGAATTRPLTLALLPPGDDRAG